MICGMFLGSYAGTAQAITIGNKTLKMILVLTMIIFGVFFLFNH